MNKLNIHWIYPEPTPYHAAFFHELDKDPSVSLEVHFTMGSLPAHPWQNMPEMSFRHRIMDFTFGFDSRLFGLALNRSNRFVISGWNSPFLVSFILWLALLRREFLFWSDTPNPFKRRGTLKQVIHRAVSTLTFRAAHKMLVTGTPGIEAFSAMGCPRDKIVSFPYFAAITEYDPFLEGRLFTRSGGGRFDRSSRQCGQGLRLGTQGPARGETNRWKRWLRVAHMRIRP